MTWRPSVAPSCPPRLLHRPGRAVGSLGPEVVELAGEFGLELDDWQALFLECALAIDPRGRWESFEVGGTVPRQNGKGGIIEARVLGGLFLLEEPLLTYTAHEFKTAQEHFLRIQNLIDAAPARYRKRVKTVRKTTGSESIIMHSGHRLRFLARSAGSGRGFSGDVVFFDEAMILYAATVGALLPTMSARTKVTPGGPQLWYTGTAGKGEQAAVLAGVRDRAIAGGDEGLFFAEWAGGTPDDHAGHDVDLDDVAEWERSNPAIGYGRIETEFVRRERASMTDDEFARERLGLWGTGALRGAIDPDVWRALGDAQSKPAGQVALAVDVPPEGRRASIARAGLRADGKVHVEVDVRPGTGWAVEALAALSKKRGAAIVLDGGSRAAALIPGLVAAGVTPVVYSTRHVVTACSGFMDRVDEDGLRHTAQPELAIAVDAARRRKVGDAWAWHRRDTSVDISPLVAATLAVHGLNEEPPKRKSGRSMAV
jgi:hypothetical protein